MAEIIFPKIEGTPTIGLFGPVSSGKTWLQIQLQRKFERSLCIDASGATLGKEYFEHIFGNPQEVADRLLKNPYYYRLAYHPQSFEVDFDWCAKFMWLADDGKEPSRQLARFLIVDEVQRVCQNHQGGMEPMMESITQLARHTILGFIGASQRISQVHKDFTAACRIIILFYTAETNDQIAISERFGKQVLTDLLSCRACIYNDSTKEVEQTPECIIWIRGMGHKKFALGDKIKSQGENQQWETETLLPQQTTEQGQSSPEHSGTLEQKSPESSPENDLPESRQTETHRSGNQSF